MPQSVRVGPGRLALPPRVSIVARPSADRAALTVVKRALAERGISTIVVRGQAPRAGVSVYLGAAGPLERTLGLAGLAGLPPGGYVLAAGLTPALRPVVVLDGVDGAGLYYAAQTFRQLLAGRRASIPQIVIRDWPALPVRGVVEGFYGTPWSLRARLSMLDFMGAHKLNGYMYAPKDDPYHRARWREPYPAPSALALERLVARAAADHVAFTFAVSPGLSICYSSTADRAALVAKLGWARSLGVRSFAVAFDDIPADRPLCDEDAARYGRDSVGVALAQADLLNELQRSFVGTGPGSATLMTVPTEYKGIESSPYKRMFAATLDRRVVVQWTGRYGISVAISALDAAAAKTIFPQPLLIWDNYFVTDYSPGFLVLGALDRHDAELPDSVTGILADPQVQEEASKIGLFTLADYAWNTRAYRPARSWAASLSEFAGGDRTTASALRAFADANYSSPLNTFQAPALSAKIDAFWSTWTAGDDGAATRLADILRRLRDGTGLLQARLGATNPDFVTETAPWLGATQAWAEAALSALDLLAARRQGAPSRVDADAQSLRALEGRARSYRSAGTDVQVAPGVLDRFVARARSEGAGPASQK